MGASRTAGQDKASATPRRQESRNSAEIHAVAAAGFEGTPSELPFAAQIQASFGDFDISGTRAYTGGNAQRANEDLGAMAYASGQRVAFRGAPDLFTAAHEAAHVIQQQAGLQLRDGVGESADPHERHADQVASRVVQGRSAVDLLSQYAQGGARPRVSERQSLQRRGLQFTQPTPGGSGPTGEAAQVAPTPTPGASTEADPARRQAIDAEFNQAKDAMNVAYLLNRQQALSSLRSQLLRPDTPEPSVAMNIITGAAAIALAAASAGIGTAVAGALVVASRQVASAMAAEAVKGSVERVVTAAASSAAGNVPSGGSKPCVDAFLFVQDQALSQAALEALQATERQRASFHSLAGDEGRVEAERFKLAANAGAARARGEQYRSSLAQWSRLLDQGSRFTGRQSYGGGLAAMDTTAPGILGIDIDVPSARDEMRVTGAHLEGVPEAAREGLRREAGEGATIADITPMGTGMTVRAIQEANSPGLFESSSSTRVRVPLESTPSRRNQPIPGPVTGNEGMFLIDRVRQKFGNPEFGGAGHHDYSATPIAAQIIWAREIATIRLSQLPAIGG